MIYLDNSATTRVSKKAAEKAINIMRNDFGNPSSIHSMGFNAEKELNTARESVARAAFVEKDELVFTSGGTEANNLAIFGAVEKLKRFGNKILTTAVEHPSVLEPMNQLEKLGLQVVYIKPDLSGNISSKEILSNITKDTILVSLMSVNNETGAITPVQGVGAALKSCGSRGLFHVDNVQGFGKLLLKPRAMGIDLMSLSAHKIHGAKGTGALYIAKGKSIMPVCFGGGQEKSLRPGTENTVGIAAMGVAASELCESKSVVELNELLRSELAKIQGIEINSPANASPYILNFSLGKIKGETMVHFLAEKQIYLSTGSACSGAKPSHVLTAMGLEKQRVEASVRVSLCCHNTKDEIYALISGLREGLESLSYR